MDLRALELLVRTAAASYANAIHYYWPAFDSNEVAEATLAMHLGATLSARGYLIYGEAPKDSDKNSKEHIDLLAIHPEHSTAIWTEAKRLYSAQKAAEVARDIVRINDAQVQERYFKPKKQFGIVIASTWVQLDDVEARSTKAEGLSFWRRGKAEHVGDQDGYCELQTKLHNVGATLGAIVTYDDTESDWGRQRVLYAIWER